MKSFKKFISEELLTEKYYKINKDVDYVYNFLFKAFVDNFKKNSEINEDLINTDWIEGDDFAKRSKNKEIKKAHELNPLDSIMFSKLSDVNVYRPAGISGNKKAQILLTPSSKSVRNLFHTYGKNVLNGVKGNNRFSLENEITEARIKGSIHHEISHWLNDSLHENHIKNRMSSHAGEVRTDYLKHMNKNIKRSHEFLTDYELDAQLHALIQYKRKNKKAWDSAKSIEDLFKKIPFTKPIRDKLSENEYKEWKKLILKRLARENLLPKNVRN